MHYFKPYFDSLKLAAMNGGTGSTVEAITYYLNQMNVPSHKVQEDLDKLCDMGICAKSYNSSGRLEFSLKIQDQFKFAKRTMILELKQEIASLRLQNEEMMQMIRQMVPPSSSVPSTVPMPTLPMPTLPMPTPVPSVQKPPVKVGSFTDSNTSYSVNIEDGTCNCPHFLFHAPIMCKHLKEVVDHPSKFSISAIDAAYLDSKCSKYPGYATKSASVSGYMAAQKRVMPPS